MAVSFLLVLLGGILLFYTNEIQNSQHVASYCGNFGMYGQRLVLMKDGTFRFSYFGCSQTGGFVKGNWKEDREYLELFSEVRDELLEPKYYVDGTHLVSVITGNEEFTFCEMRD